MDFPQIPGFQIESALFDDPFSNYYKAKHLKLNKPLWLRVLNSSKKANIEEFQKQAEHQSRVNHPFVLSILDMGHHEKVYYQTFHTIVGESIYQRFKRTQVVFEEKEALEILAQLAELFEYTERKKLVHRALSPKNIYLTEGEQYAVGIKVHEFGFLLDPTIWFYQPKSSVTPTYISPEQANGSPPESITVQSDIYSAGIILFHMLAGRPPFEGNKLEIMSAHLKKEIPNAKDFNENLSEEVCALIRQMTQKNPEKRFPVVKELSATLQEILQNANKPLSRGIASERSTSANSVAKTNREIKIKEISAPSLKVASSEKKLVSIKEVAVKEIELPPKDPEHFRLKRKRRKQMELALTWLSILILLIASYFLYDRFLKPGIEENTSFSNSSNPSDSSPPTKTPEEAKRLLDFAEQFIQNHPLPKDHEQSIDFLKKIIQEFPQTSEAEIAKTLMDSKQRDFEASAEKQFLKTKSNAQKAIQNGLFQEAIDFYQQFPEDFRSTLWYSQSKTNATVLEKMRTEQVQKWFYQANDFVEEGRFSEAISLYQKILTTGDPQRQTEARQSLEKAKLSLKKMSEKK